MLLQFGKSLCSGIGGNGLRQEYLVQLWGQQWPYLAHRVAAHRERSLAELREEIRQLKADGYHPEICYKEDDELRQVIDLVRFGVFSNGDANLFAPLVDALLGRDEYLLLHDYRSYIDCQAAVSRRYVEREAWVRSSILNTARIGKFSSDRAIRQYCRDVWRVQPVSSRSTAASAESGAKESA